MISCLEFDFCFFDFILCWCKSGDLRQLGFFTFLLYYKSLHNFTI